MLVATLSAAGIGGALMQVFGNVLYPSLIALALLLASTILLIWVAETRQEGEARLAAREGRTG